MYRFWKSNSLFQLPTGRQRNCKRNDSPSHQVGFHLHGPGWPFEAGLVKIQLYTICSWKRSENLGRIDCLHQRQIFAEPRVHPRADGGLMLGVGGLCLSCSLSTLGHLVVWRPPFGKSWLVILPSTWAMERYMIATWRFWSKGWKSDFVRWWTGGIQKLDRVNFCLSTRFVCCVFFN